MTDKQTTKWNLQTWHSETKIYPGGAAYSLNFTRERRTRNTIIRTAIVYCLAFLSTVAVNSVIIVGVFQYMNFDLRPRDNHGIAYLRLVCSWPRRRLSGVPVDSFTQQDARLEKN